MPNTFITSTPTTPSTLKQTIDLKQQVTDTLISQLEKGIVPWERPWKEARNGLPVLPMNCITGKRYNGINILLLWSAAIQNDYASNEWATFKQWAAQKEAIQKGEKGSLVVYYDTFEKEENGEAGEIPSLKSSYVFNRCQLASYTPPIETAPTEPSVFLERIAQVEQFVQNTNALIRHGDWQPCYHQTKDTIFMPMTERFEAGSNCTAEEHYYSTVLHELVHWTAHPERVKRGNIDHFDEKDYFIEELVAELGSVFLCAALQINPLLKGDHASYVGTWLKLLKGDKKHIFTAVSEASKALDYLQDLQP